MEIGCQRNNDGLPGSARGNGYPTLGTANLDIGDIDADCFLRGNGLDGIQPRQVMPGIARVRHLLARHGIAARFPQGELQRFLRKEQPTKISNTENEQKKQRAPPGQTRRAIARCVTEGNGRDLVLCGLTVSYSFPPSASHPNETKRSTRATPVHSAFFVPVLAGARQVKAQKH